MTAEGIDYLDFDFCQNIEPCAHRKKSRPKRWSGYRAIRNFLLEKSLQSFIDQFAGGGLRGRLGRLANDGFAALF